MKTMSKKNIAIFLFVLAALAAVAIYREYNRTNTDLGASGADFTISADSVLHQFATDEHASNVRYLGKILQVNGPVKSIDKDPKGFITCVLASNDAASVRCLIDSAHTQEAVFKTTPQALTIRGVCAGYTPDEIGLGADLVLSRCVIVTTK